MPDRTEKPRESVDSLINLRDHHRNLRPWGQASDVIVQICEEALLLMGERAEARGLAESLHHDERVNMGRHSEYERFLPWQLKTCPDCGGDGRDAEHHHVTIMMDTDCIRCAIHGDVGGSRSHGMCDTCKGRGKVPKGEPTNPEPAFAQV